MSELVSQLTAVTVLIIAIFIYFLPSWIASNRNHHNKTAIFVMNCFLGWTALGWIVALIWAYAGEKTKKNHPEKSLVLGTDDSDVRKSVIIDIDRKPCPECGEMIPLIARKCRFCGYELILEKN